jgi:predicted nucleic acid-binding protein
MAEALVLDSEALNALARASQRGVLEDRAQAVLSLARDRRAFVRVPAPVLGEVCRGPRFDARGQPRPQRSRHRRAGSDAVDRTARRTALAVARMSSANAVDAFVVASALEFDRALIATGDPDDIRRLAARHLGVFRI